MPVLPKANAEAQKAKGFDLRVGVGIVWRQVVFGSDCFQVTFPQEN
jgi:hypothetical protein